MKYLLLAALLPSVIFATSVREEQAQTVLVTSEGLQGGGRGTGVLLDETHILTCAHMAKSEKEELFVYTYPLGSVVRARLEFVDRSNDLAILLLDQPVVVSRYPVFEHHWTEGDPITVVGNALGAMKWLVVKGVIAGEEREDLVTDARVNPGNSGGPWFDADGSIVAISAWGIGPHEGRIGLAGGISANKIEAFLAHCQSARVVTAIRKSLVVRG